MIDGSDRKRGTFGPGVLVGLDQNVRGLKLSYDEVEAAAEVDWISEARSLLKRARLTGGAIAG
jgi:hypothetical protein